MTNLEKLKNLINHLIDKYHFHLIASDTHRWVSGDGFYEVQFTLFEPDNALEIYLTTTSGGQDFEDEWSSEESTITDWTSIELYFEEDNAKYVLSQIKENLPDYLYADDFIVGELFDNFYTEQIYINSDNVKVLIEDIDFSDKTSVGFSNIIENSISMVTIKEFLTRFKVI
jgi:hypothetical protein